MKIKEVLSEGLRKAPTTSKHIAYLKDIFESPLPAGMARSIIFQILDDDDLNDRIDAMESTDPNSDARELVSEWINLNMPELLQTAKEGQMVGNGEGYYSPISGYSDDFI